MYLRGYVNDVFSDYLNRYLRGILIFRNKLKGIRVFYTLSEAFSNSACRFYVQVRFHKLEDLDEDEKRLAYECFYDRISSNGNEFVSFVYKNNREYDIDAEVIRSFMFHYQFASNIFEGVVKPLLPETCAIEIEDLSQEPFFNYLGSFFSHLKWHSKTAVGFEERYFDLMKRHFSFDCHFHETLVTAGNNWERVSNDETVTDKALCDAGGGDLEAIRRFVIEKNIPFHADHNAEVVHEIHIHQQILKSAVKSFRPDYSPYETSRVNPSKIILFITEKENRLLVEKTKFEKCVAESELDIGDVAMFKKSAYGVTKEEIGMIKGFRLNYRGDLEMKVQLLKSDLSESKITKDGIKAGDVSEFIKGRTFLEGINKQFKSKNEFIEYLKAHGVKGQSRRKITLRGRNT